MTFPQGSLERLEPRWAPARLTGGGLPAQFGVDLNALAEEMGSLALAVSEWSANDLIAGSITWLRVPQLADTPTWAGTIRDRLASAGLGEAEGEGDSESGGGTTSGGTIELVGGSFFAGSITWTTRTDYSGGVLKLGAGTLTLAGASLTYGGQSSLVNSVANLQTFDQITQIPDAQLLQRRDALLTPTSISGGTLLLGDEYSVLSRFSDSLRLAGSSLGAVTLMVSSSSGSLSTVSPELLVALTSAGVTAAAPAETPVEQAPEVSSDPTANVSPQAIEPPVQPAE